MKKIGKARTLFLRKKLGKKNNKDKHNGSCNELMLPSRVVSERRWASMGASMKAKHSDFSSSSLCPPPTTSTNVSPLLLSASNTGSVAEVTSTPNCARDLQTHSTPSIFAASKLRTNVGSGDALLSTTRSSIFSAPSSTTSSGSANGMSSSLLFFLRNSFR